jgi:S1-C subfamily serine protease
MDIMRYLKRRRNDMKKISRSTEAIAWMTAKLGRTQLDASAKFGISQGAISSTKAREDHAILFCEKFPDLVDRVLKVLDVNPQQAPRGVAYKLGVPEPDARLVLLGLNIRAVRSEAQFRESAANMDANDDIKVGARHGYDCGRRDGLAAAAKIAEMVGGEYGAAIAAAIRSVEV